MSLRTGKKASVPRARRLSVWEIALEGRPGLSSCKALPASAGIFLLPEVRGGSLESTAWNDTMISVVLKSSS